MHRTKDTQKKTFHRPQYRKRHNASTEKKKNERGEPRWPPTRRLGLRHPAAAARRALDAHTQREDLLGLHLSTGAGCTKESGSDASACDTHKSAQLPIGNGGHHRKPVSDLSAAYEQRKGMHRVAGTRAADCRNSYRRCLQTTTGKREPQNTESGCAPSPRTMVHMCSRHQATHTHTSKYRTDTGARHDTLLPMLPAQLIRTSPAARWGAVSQAGPPPCCPAC